MAGPNNDRSNTKVVVEQIPEEKFDDQSVRDFFSEFGTITEVSMQAYKRLAIVTFEDYWAARRAYESPKVIFDNRFVKVYWHKPDTSGSPDPSGASHGRPAPTRAKAEDEEMIDPEEFARKQEEAQRAHEEKAQKLKEATAAREELERKMKAQAEERRKLLEKLAARTGPGGVGKSASPSTTPAPPSSATADGSPASAAAPTAAPASPDTKKSSQTDALRAKLRELEAEAESMGLATDEPPYAGGRGRGRGGFRARGAGAFGPPRGRGYDASFRGGGYRGRGFGARGGGVMRLDNRTKKVAVGGVEWTPERDEALRQYLFVSLAPFPTFCDGYRWELCRWSAANFDDRAILSTRAWSHTRTARTRRS